MRGETAREEFRRELSDVLRNMRRRYALYYLHQQDGAVGLDEMTDQIAAWERDAEAGEVPSEQRRSVYNALYQTHLPRLEELGVVAFDSDAKTVSLADRGKALELHFASNLHSRHSWYRYYLALSAVVLLAAGLRWVGVPAIGGVPEPFWSLAVVGPFLLLAAVHAYTYASWRRRLAEGRPDFVLDVDGDDLG